MPEWNPRMKTRDEFLTHWEQELQNILFRGYTTQERDPAQLFRKMCHEARVLRDALGRMWAEMHPELPKEQPKNGAVQPQQKAVK